MRKGWIAACIARALLMFGLLSLSTFAVAETTLNFGLYNSDKPTTMIKKFRPVINAIESRVEAILGVQVTIRLQVAKSYEQGIDDLVSGKVDFARFGPVSYIEAKEQNPDIAILAVEAKGGKKVYRGIICTAKDSHIREIGDLKGKRFAFGNEHSTTGRYLSQLYLVEHGIRVSDLEHYEYLGRHDKVGNAVALGKFDAGALKENTFRKLVNMGKPLKALAHFPHITKPWIARSGLAEKVQKALKRALLEMDDKVALKALQKDGFLPGDDADYAPMREAMTRSNEFFEPSRTR